MANVQEYAEKIVKLVQDAVEAERERCASIVQEARNGDRDTDLRSIIYAIKNP